MSLITLRPRYRVVRVETKSIILGDLIADEFILVNSNINLEKVIDILPNRYQFYVLKNDLYDELTKTLRRQRLLYDHKYNETSSLFQDIPPAHKIRHEFQIGFFSQVGKEETRKLLNSRIMIIGLGGFGNWLILGLLSAGIRSFTLVDGAILDEPDLGRQVLYRTDDLGLFKAEAAKREILKINPSINIQTYNEHIDSATYPKLINRFKPSMVAFCITGSDLPIEAEKLRGKKGPSLIKVCGFVGPISDPVKNPLAFSRFKSYLHEMGTDALLQAINLESRNRRHRYMGVGTLFATAGTIAAFEITKYILDLGNELYNHVYYITPTTIKVIKCMGN